MENKYLTMQMVTHRGRDKQVHVYCKVITMLMVTHRVATYHPTILSMSRHSPTMMKMRKKPR